jgi:hypothetical protein
MDVNRYRYLVAFLCEGGEVGLGAYLLDNSAVEVLLRGRGGPGLGRGQKTATIPRQILRSHNEDVLGYVLTR